MNNMSKEITDETWSTRCALVNAYLAENDVGGAKAGLEWAMDAGSKDKANRPTLWQNIYNTCKLLPNNPLGGVRSNIPADVLTAVKGLKQQIYDAYMSLASAPIFGRVYGRRGQYTPLHGDAETMAEYESEIFYDSMTAMYRAYVKKDSTKKQWNGKLDKNGLPKIVVPTKQTEVDG